MSNPVGRPKKVEYTHKALSTYQDTDGQWKLVSLSFNPVVEEVSDKLEVLAVDNSKGEIDYQFKINAAKLNIVGF